VPFGIYAFFPFFVSVLGSSGWYFSKFEKENEVRLFVYVYGLHYWKEQNPVISDRFYYFIRDLVSRDFSSLYLHVGYSNLYIKEFSKKDNVDVSTRQELDQILNVMKKYRRVFLSIYAGFMIALPLLVLWLFVLTSTHTFGMQQVIAHRIVSGREITIVLGVTPFVAVFSGVSYTLWYTRKKFREVISGLLDKVDSNKLSLISS
jgi:bacteriorhodopsin